MGRTSNDEGLMPWDEVAAEFTRRTGRPISRNTCCTTALRAQKKIAMALLGTEYETYLLDDLRAAHARHRAGRAS